MSGSKLKIKGKPGDIIGNYQIVKFLKIVKKRAGKDKEQNDVLYLVGCMICHNTSELRQSYLYNMKNRQTTYCSQCNYEQRKKGRLEKAKEKQKELSFDYVKSKKENDLFKLAIYGKLS